MRSVVSVIFPPRPSGRGSVAAPGRSKRTRSSSASLPGHQAGAPLRHGHNDGRRWGQGRPSPAIRPGLRCGTTCAPVGAGCLPSPSPAIRPGLRCGFSTGITSFDGTAALPGHQAGAPLRHLPPSAAPPNMSRPPRPSGRGSVAARRSVWASAAGCAPPRPSGRGSVAAASRPARGRRRPQPSPAIRPGLRCGNCTTRSCSVTAFTLPGHQAGAPLRRLDVIGPDHLIQRPSPAIRPGLRCGCRLAW